MRKKKHLIIIGHPDKKSFCYNGIFSTIVRELEDNNETFKIIDVYEDKLSGINAALDRTRMMCFLEQES